jgi:hypothetical protein
LAGRSIAEGTEGGVSAKSFRDTADDVKRGVILPPTIVVGASRTDGLVILEGHHRMTSYLMEPDYIPKPLPVIVGLSPSMSKWHWY